MRNPLDYLWFKMYKLSFYTHDIEPAITMSSILVINSLTICFLIFGKAVFSIGFSMLLIVLCLFITHPYVRHKKKIKILRKYYKESKKSRIRGNFIVTIYVILSLAAPLIIAKLRNGYIFQ
jgi:hypothetical protein